MHSYQPTHTHTHTDVVLNVSDFIITLFLLVLFYFPVIPLPVGLTITGRPAWVAALGGHLSDGLVVSLPYSGVYCVNAGLWGDQINRTDGVEHKARDPNPRVLWNEFQVRWGELRLLTAWFWNQTFTEISAEPFPTLIFCVLISCVCIQYMYLFALIDYEENISIFCNCSLMCHNSCFLAHC